MTTDQVADAVQAMKVTISEVYFPDRTKDDPKETISLTVCLGDVKKAQKALLFGKCDTEHCVFSQCLRRNFKRLTGMTYEECESSCTLGEPIFVGSRDVRINRKIYVYDEKLKHLIDVFMDEYRNDECVEIFKADPKNLLGKVTLTYTHGV